MRTWFKPWLELFAKAVVITIAVLVTWVIWTELGWRAP